MDINKIQESYAKNRQSQDEATKSAKNSKKHIENITGSDRVQKAVYNSAIANIKHRDEVTDDAIENLERATKAIQELNLTTFNANQPGFASVVEDVRKLYEELNTKLDALSSKFTGVGFEPVSNSIQQLVDKLSSMPKEISDITVKVEKDSMVEEILRDVLESVKKLKLDPKIAIKAPVVTVPKIDTSRLEELLEKDAESDKLEIADFMVENQENEDTMQYFGLVHPSGAWMIIQNEIETGSYGYAFGSDEYDFEARANLEYGSVTRINALRS